MSRAAGEMNPAARLGHSRRREAKQLFWIAALARADPAVLSRAIGGDVRVRRRTESIAETREQVVVRRTGRDAVG